GQPQTDALADLAAMGGVVVNLIFGACVPALGEEFLFRHVLYRKMRGCGDATYIFFSAFCFALFHGNFAQMLYAFAVGVIFAWVYVKTGNIWVSVALHFIINCMGIVVAPLLLENELATMMMGVAVIAFIAGAIVIFVKMRKRVWAGLTPPTEAGWPASKPRGWQRKMAAQLHPFYYTMAMEEMQYPPYSDDPEQNRNIVYSIQQAAMPPQQPAFAAQGQTPVANAQPQVPPPLAAPMAQPWQPAPATAAQSPPGTTGVPPKKQGGIARLCLANVGMVLYMLVSLGLAIVSLFVGMLV
ncbi:CPBP family intramembrane metalloprotease, partial [Ruminococcaceae bacterium OttesenSCG-928-A16]|nr:CPBP family intramembrane metalloprotease [Ruminococcaceae bacterium OttesenSCG-928-A16]